MPLVDKLKQYPLVLWVLALYLCSLAFNLKYDIPLAIFAMVSAYALANSVQVYHYRSLWHQHWHVLLFVLVATLVTATSENIKHSLEVQVQFIPALLIYVVIAQFANNKSFQDFVIMASVFAGLVIGLVLLSKNPYGTDVDSLAITSSAHLPLFVVPNDALFFSVLAPLALYAGLNTKNYFLRVVAMLYLLVGFWTTIHMQSRQAVAVFILATFCFLFLLRPLYGVVVVVAGVVAALSLDWLLGHGLMNKLVYLFPRRYVWESAWKMFLERPLIGHGPGAFRILYPDFLEKAGYLREQVEDRRDMCWAHSLYLEQLAERGLVGLLALVLLIGRPVAALMTRLNLLTLKEKSLLAATLALLLAGVAEASLLRLWVVVIIFLLLGLLNRDGNEPLV